MLQRPSYSLNITYFQHTTRPQQKLTKGKADSAANAELKVYFPMMNIGPAGTVQLGQA